MTGDPTRIAVFSGKGGTGKTTLVASLVRLAGRVVAVDCDVDAANLALLVPGEDGPPTPFVAGEKARIDPDACLGCGECADACSFGAVVPDAGVYRVRQVFCEGCRACGLACPTGAIRYEPDTAGTWRVRRTPEGWLVHARLGIAQDNSGKLVSEVRKAADRIAAEEGIGLVLIDGPPGVGCPVHAAIGGVDLALVVAEPTPAGHHDMERMLELARHFDIPAAVLINKHDLSPPGTRRIEETCARLGVPVLGRIPFDPAVPGRMAQGRTPLGGGGEVERSIREIHAALAERAAR